jgi:RNA polymerase sigma factor (TIGR02999 family)
VSDVTRLLDAIDRGDRQAADGLFPLVYNELRRLAAAQMARERPGQTLDATALVHEAYLRLVGDQTFAGRRHFFGAAARAMRHIHDFQTLVADPESQTRPREPVRPAGPMN